jgi:hemerythrin
MPLIKWRDSYSVGVATFDDNNKVLLEVINEIFIVLREKQTVDHLVVTINKLIQYTQEQFSDEEEALEEINFPRLEYHKRMHGKLLNEVAVYKKLIDNKDEKAIQGLYSFLRDWLLTHIVEEDMQYKPFLTDTETTAP